MNPLLIRSGYPPIAVRPENRKTYLDALERASLADDLAPYQQFIGARLDATFDGYLSAVREAMPDIAADAQRLD